MAVIKQGAIIRTYDENDDNSFSSINESLWSRVRCLTAAQIMKNICLYFTVVYYLIYLVFFPQQALFAHF